jgi:hypothetical protein
MPKVITKPIVGAVVERARGVVNTSLQVTGANLLGCLVKCAFFTS